MGGVSLGHPFLGGVKKWLLRFFSLRFCEFFQLPLLSVLMGRGRGKGKKLTVSTSHDDPESGGEEVLPTYKRRGRPQKPFKDDVDEEDYGKIEEEEEEEEENYGRTLISSKDDKTVDENGKKR